MRNCPRDVHTSARDRGNPPAAHGRTAQTYPSRPEAAVPLALQCWYDKRARYDYGQHEQLLDGMISRVSFLEPFADEWGQVLPRLVLGSINYRPWSSA